MYDSENRPSDTNIAAAALVLGALAVLYLVRNGLRGL